MHFHVIFPYRANMHSTMVKHAPMSDCNSSALCTLTKATTEIRRVRTSRAFSYRNMIFNHIVYCRFYSNSSSHFIHSFIHSVVRSHSLQLLPLPSIPLLMLLLLLFCVVVTFHLYGFSDPIRSKPISVNVLYVYRHIHTDTILHNTTTMCNNVYNHIENRKQTVLFVNRNKSIFRNVRF